MRLAASQHIPDGLADVRYRWAWRDVVEGIAMLDYLDDVARWREEMARRESGR